MPKRIPIIFFLTLAAALTMLFAANVVLADLTGAECPESFDNTSSVCRGHKLEIDPMWFGKVESCVEDPSGVCTEYRYTASILQDAQQNPAGSPINNVAIQIPSELTPKYYSVSCVGAACSATPYSNGHPTIPFFGRMITTRDTLVVTFSPQVTTSVSFTLKFLGLQGRNFTDAVAETPEGCDYKCVGQDPFTCACTCTTWGGDDDDDECYCSASCTGPDCSGFKSCNGYIDCEKTSWHRIPGPADTDLLPQLNTAVSEQKVCDGDNCCIVEINEGPPATVSVLEGTCTATIEDRPVEIKEIPLRVWIFATASPGCWYYTLPNGEDCQVCF